jgi:hypothetical protein
VLAVVVVLVVEEAMEERLSGALLKVWELRVEDDDGWIWEVRLLWMDERSERMEFLGLSIVRVVVCLVWGGSDPATTVLVPSILSPVCGRYNVVR